MHVSFDESAYRTLKLFLISCKSTVGEEVLKAYFLYEGIFPATAEDILGKFSWTVEKVPDNIFFRLKEYTQRIGKDILSAEDICLYFASEEHLKTAKNSCLVYPDLNNDQRIAGHMTLPVKITDVDSKVVSAKAVYTGIPIRNLVNIFPDLKVGDTALIHFSTIVFVRPSEDMIMRLFEIQEDFIKQDMPLVKELDYKSTTDQAIEKIKKYNIKTI